MIEDIIEEEIVIKEKPKHINRDYAGWCFNETTTKPAYNGWSICTKQQEGVYTK
jgi:hypothetical protein